MIIKKLWDGPDPGATPGRVFTGSIGREQIVQYGPFLQKLSIGLKYAITTAAVAVEDAIDQLSEFIFSVGTVDVIKLDGNDLIALMAFYYKQLPGLGENSDNTGTDFFQGIQVPVHAKADPAKPFSMAATRAAVANVGAETIAVTGYFLEQDYGLKPIHAVAVSDSTSGAAGNDIKNWRLPPIGRLIGLILAIPAASDFTDGNIDITAQRVKLVRDGETVAELNTLADSQNIEEVNYVSLSIYGDLLARYKRFDFRPEGFDLKSGVYTLTLDNQDTSDAIRVIPVIEQE